MSAHKAVNCVALHGENLKMGKDVRCARNRKREMRLWRMPGFQRSGRMKIWGGSRTQRANILSSQIAFCEKGELYIEYRRMSCKERSGKLCKFCEKDETTSAPLPTRRPYPDYGKLPNFHYLSWSATPTDGREPDDFQPRAQIKRLFEESELVSGDSEAIRRFSDKYIVPEKLVAEYVEHLAQIKMRKEKKKEETETGANGTAEPGVQ